MEKAVLIELGPTSLRMITTKLIGGAYHKIIDEIEQTLRFDEDIYENNMVGVAKINEAIKIVKFFQELCESQNIVKIYAYASSIFDKISNRKTILEDLSRGTNLNFNILSEEEEIKLIYSTILNSVEPSKGIILFVNPHNTYVINFAKRNLLGTYILPVGSNSLAYKYKCEEGDTPKNVIENMVSYAKQQISALNLDFSMVEEVNFIGAGSTFLTLSKLVRKMTHYPLDMDNNFVCQKEDFEKAFKTIGEFGFDRTKRLSGISADRLDNIVGGFAIISAFNELQNPKEYTIASRGISDAVMSSKVVKESSCDSTTNDLLEMNLENIRYYYEIEDSNAEYVYNFMIELFKQTAIIHKLTRKQVKSIKIATLLYDCGKRISFENHTKYSKDIILNSNIMGVNHKDLIIAGFACQYQNLDNFSLAEWIKYKSIVDEEDMQTARKIGTLISLASSLDCTKQHRIKEVSCDLLGDIVIIKAKSNYDVEYEKSEANKLSSSFKKVFGKSYEII